jgi:cold shock CspA family protein
MCDLWKSNVSGLLMYFAGSTPSPSIDLSKILPEKGYGFIKREGLADLFFHASECNDKFKEVEVGMVVQLPELWAEKKVAFMMIPHQSFLNQQILMLVQFVKLSEH